MTEDGTETKTVTDRIRRKMGHHKLWHHKLWHRLSCCPAR